MSDSKAIDLDKPRFDQSTYYGRMKHFLNTTNPLNVLKSSAELENAKMIVANHRAGKSQPELTEDDLWNAKHLYDSAFHPDTGEKTFILGRMSFQVPGNMFITGCMMTFYRSTPAVISWQWINQTFNALVNYSNRSGDAPISVQRLGISYILATTGAVGTALTINNSVKRLPPLVGRFVPFVAVGVANCINIPCMRSQELSGGITITDDKGNKLGESPRIAKEAIGQVVVSRILMASPGMVFPPIVMNLLEKRGLFNRYKWLAAPLQISLVGLMLTFATPMCCALFPQQCSVEVTKLEPELQATIKARFKGSPPEKVYYNKGL